ncbi:hypothetical protein LXA43DRAFT_1060810 [Ganoderma leucocontextum]|nr:hypothetical protein LXA43DRAFT_1060810 [Ganoderma leucocontextum]
MASSLYFPVLYDFYPIGNTPAICVTRDVPLEGPVSILLLPCGDPRNILYTVFCEAPNCLRRSLDFTCCDYDPGILARNVLLLTMIMDGVSAPTMWNIFFHMYLDIDSRSTLVSQSQKLASYTSVAAWRSSPYGPVIKMGTDHTLIELRRHWELYADFYKPSKLHRLRELQAVMDDKLKKIAANAPEINLIPTLSSGPLFLQSNISRLFSEQHRRYWETGTTLTDNNSLAAATHPNSTFFYSRAGEGFDVPFNTDPMTPLHHAPLFGNTNRTLTIADLVKSARSQFREWCSIFETTATTGKGGAVDVRFLLGDALAVARALRDFGENTSVQAQGFAAPKVAPWTTCTLELNREEYTDFGAPTRFDVIDTSNVADYLGLLNIFLATTPLLTESPSSVLYTESFSLFAPDLRTEFEATLFASLSVVAILMDLAPVNALSGFTSRCDTHEIAATFVSSKDKDRHRQIFTWRRPSSGDPSAYPDGGPRAPAACFDTHQLVELLHSIYVDMFKDDDQRYLQTLAKTMGPEDLKRETRRYVAVCPSREAFVLFLDSIRTSLSISTKQWLNVLSSFLDLHSDDRCRIGDFELGAQVLRHGLHTSGSLDQVRRPTVGRLSHWQSIPPLIRVFLAVPRAEFAKLETATAAAGLPFAWLRCYIKLPQGSHVFHSVDAAYGTLVDAGTAAKPDLSFREDPDGRKNGADLVFSFVVPSPIFTVAPAGDIFVQLGIRGDPHMARAVAPVLPSLCLFSACLEDTNYVHLLPEQPLPPRPPALKTTVRPQQLADTFVAIGCQQPVRVDMDTVGKHVASVTAKLEITNTTIKTAFAEGAVPTVSQCSPCVIRVVLGGRTQTLAYPVPIAGSQRKVRLARKSSYIEVVVPVAIPFLKPDGFKLNPFPVVRANASIFPWNVHRVFLDQLPVLNIENIDIARLKQWYDPHVDLQLSLRNSASIWDPARADVLANIKQTIQLIMRGAAETGGGKPAREFVLHNDASKTFDTILFVDKVRYDLSSHAMVCDAFVLPISPAIAPHIGPSLEALFRRGPISVLVPTGETMRGWKQLLPALAERCRATWTHGAKCEYVTQGRIPLEVGMEGDPLCSCGRGKDVGGMLKDGVWKKLAPFATRIALSPLFAVSCFEETFGQPAASSAPAPGPIHGSKSDRETTSSVATCERCKKQESGVLKLLRCSRCKKAAYCSQACQKSDWKTHKLRCGN